MPFALGNTFLSGNGHCILEGEQSKTIRGNEEIVILPEKLGLGFLAAKQIPSIRVRFPYHRLQRLKHCINTTPLFIQHQHPIF